MLDAEALIKKHRAKGALIDTNLLVLLLVGLVNPRRILNFKRTQNYTIEDYRLLRDLVGWFGAPLVSTPHILSQVSDLTDLAGSEQSAVRRLFKSLIVTIDERYDSARSLAQGPFFERFGLSDAAVSAIGKQTILVLTADVQLQIALAINGLDALNFNHVRLLGSRNII